MNKLNYIFAMLLVPSFACGPDFEPQSLDQNSEAQQDLGGFEKPGRVPLDADLSQAPEGQISLWIMGDEWRADEYAPLYQGAGASISVTPERLSGCGESPSVTAFLRSDQGEKLEIALQRQDGYGNWNGSFIVPAAARELQVWLRADDGAGCAVWDSANGRNHRFAVHRWTPTTVHFRSDWSEQADGPVLQGGVLVVDYALERLPWCRIVYRGFQTWDIIAHIRIDGVELPGHSVVLSAPGSGQGADVPREPALAFFAIPWEARDVELWFENSEYPPLCQTWDSDYGRNYHLRPEPAGPTPPGARLVFAPAWQEHASGPLFAGAALTLVASPARFPRCGVAGLVTAGLRASDGTLSSVALDHGEADGSRSATFALPESGDRIELWLHSQGPDGCDEYDSRYGRNYRFALGAW